MAKLHRVLQNSFVEQVDQLVCYVTGVGTRLGERIRGGAFGYDLSDNIAAATVREHIPTACAVG